MNGLCELINMLLNAPNSECALYVLLIDNSLEYTKLYPDGNMRIDTEDRLKVY